ncbi:uncharacterized protein LOC122379380 [Amphibalanus amphitrite]|uniref:uncharacterized protein LOC122379380 n=1 Tax=Amphibalanus amphitrite TaxID=1232801 RepID=UPI001C9229FC|nr:uncharacterized protein LOC122379380 [Amphibalanus amphitrite]
MSDVEEESGAAVVDTNAAEPELPAPAFDLRAIPEFDGTGDVVKWLEQAKQLCALRRVSLAAVLPTRLRDQAYEVWASLSETEQRDAEIVRDKLHSAFAMGPDAAMSELYRRRLEPGESVDAYLGSIKRLMSLIGYVSSTVMTVHFLQGLPAEVRLTVRNSVGDGTLTLERAVAIARSTLAITARERAAAPVAAVQLPPPSVQQQRATRGTARRPPLRCWTCGQMGHIARLCPNGRGDGATSAPRAPPSPAAATARERPSSPSP